MYNRIIESALNRAGEYNLSNVLLVLYQSSEDGSSQTKKIDISQIIAEISIFESIYDKTLSGAITLVDAQNLLGFLPLTGFERLEFKLRTPSITKQFDFTEETGHPLFIYKVSNRVEVNPRTQGYTLNFVSKEFIVNQQIRLNHASKKEISNIIIDIVQGSEYLNSAKNIYIEETAGIQKYVHTSLKPFEAIDMLSLDAKSKYYHNAGMYFYETANGFNFRSLENMLVSSVDSPRTSVAKFSPKTANVRNDLGNRRILEDMTTIRNFKILSQFDTLKNIREGVYASKLITHDNFNKTYKQYNFNYETEFPLAHHTESDQGKKTSIGAILPDLNFKSGKKISDFNEGTQYFLSDTENIHSNSGNYTEKLPIESILQRRLSQRLAFEAFRVELELFGFTGLSSGDIVDIDIPSYEEYEPRKIKDIDPTASGRYLVTSIRHIINFRDTTHFMHIECLKDSIAKSYPDQDIDTFTHKEKDKRLNADNGIFSIKELDDKDIIF